MGYCAASTRAPKMQSRHSTEDEIRLVVSLAKDGNDDSITTEPASRERHCVFEFYSGNTNVTPREIISAKYPKLVCEDNQCKNRLVSMMHTYNWSHENYCDFFLTIGSKTIGDLLDDVLSFKPPPTTTTTTTTTTTRFKGTETYDDVRPGGVVAHGYYREIELAESPTILILHVPNAVTVEGDGDYERIRKTDGIYRENCARTRLKADTVTQTISPFVDHKDEECQTWVSSASTVGGQVNAFDIVDAYDDARSSSASAVAEDAATNGGNTSGNSTVDGGGVIDETALLFVTRIAAQNAMTSADGRAADDDRPSAGTGSVGLVYRFRLTLGQRHLAVRCTHWNETEVHLLAVAYSESIHDDGGGPNAVAVWSTKNPYTPERFYEFGESAITCIRFSTVCPNRLAVGFHNGEILIIDISSECLQIVYQKSKQSTLDINGILGLFWTVRVDNGLLLRANRSECLVTCNTSGSIERYRYWNGAFERKIICENDSLVESDEHLISNVKKYSKPICNATKFFGFDQKTYLVGTGDGVVYTCKYDNLRCQSTKTMAHLGVIKSLEKSPYSPDVYLTTGCDCSVKIWIGDIFVEPVIVLNGGDQIEKAVWSRTNSTVVVSVVDNCLHVWDIDVTLDSPISVRELRVPSGHQCTDVEFTYDGEHLCASDTSGTVVVYAWSDVAATGGRRAQERDGLMCCIAKNLYGKTYLSKMLRKQRPEYVDVFAAVYDEQE